jgi:hypothetical protein
LFMLSRTQILRKFFNCLMYDEKSVLVSLFGFLGKWYIYNEKKKFVFLTLCLSLWVLRK